MRAFDVAEWSRTVLDVGQPTSLDLELADQLNRDYGHRLELRWLHGGKLEVRANSWVGVVRLESLVLRVRPKFAGNELGVVQMLDYASGLSAAKTSASGRMAEFEGLGLLELLALLFAQDAERLVLDGLMKDYRHEDGSLSVLRGKLRFRDQAIHRFGRLDRLECSFDEFDADVLENQLLLAGATAGARLCPPGPTQRRLRRLESTLGELVSSPPAEPDVYRRALAYSRRNEHYRRAHGYALLLLEQAGLDDLFSTGASRTFAFLFDMNQLFELFIAQLVREAFRGEEWSVLSQRHVRSVISDRATGRTYSSVIPDLVLSRADEEVPFDCKYKLYGKDRKISTADIYQSFLYAFALDARVAGQLPRAGLLYPAAHTEQGAALSIRRVSSDPLALVSGIGIDLVSVIESMAEPSDWQDSLAKVREAMGSVLQEVA
jgi:5-methylcytosine-specific restriction enzyme subunit McrC